MQEDNGESKMRQVPEAQRGDERETSSSWRIQEKQPSPTGAGYQGPRKPPPSARHCQAPRPTAEQDYVINDCISPDSFSFSSNLACLPS